MPVVNVTADSLFSSEELDACLDPESMIAPDSPGVSVGGTFRVTAR